MITHDVVHASITEAIEIQQKLRKKVSLRIEKTRPRIIAGIDVGYDPQRNLSKAALVVMEESSNDIAHSVVAFDATSFPYVPGLLSFRETPVILKALSCLKTSPDLLFVDGHGIAHPRRLGIAAHIGVLTGLPTIGVAKKKLCGRYTEPAPGKGSVSDLMDKGEKIGTVLRSRDNTKPLFISPGHRMDHEGAVAWVEKYLVRYRLPEPTRLADKLSKI
jgi:deoxyribonuclease V